MRRRAFVDNELLIVIAMVAVWLGIAIPIYGQAVRAIEHRGVQVGPAHHIACLAAALVAPPLLVGLLCGLERAVDWAREAAARRRNRENDR